MPDEMRFEVRHTLRVPCGFKRENREEQIVSAGHVVDAAFPRGPYLRRNILNNLWRPSWHAGRDSPHGQGEAAVKAGEVHTDQNVRLPLGGDLQQRVEQTTKLAKISQHFNQAYDGMGGEVESQIDTGPFHP